MGFAMSQSPRRAARQAARPVRESFQRGILLPPGTRARSLMPLGADAIAYPALDVPTQDRALPIGSRTTRAAIPAN